MITSNVSLAVREGFRVCPGEGNPSSLPPLPLASRCSPSTLDTVFFLCSVLFLSNFSALSSTGTSSRQIWPSSSLVASQRLHGKTRVQSSILSSTSTRSRYQAVFRPLLSCRILSLFSLPRWMHCTVKMSSWRPTGTHSWEGKNGAQGPVPSLAYPISLIPD